jgi:hypothetical protein
VYEAVGGYVGQFNSKDARPTGKLYTGAEWANVDSSFYTCISR